MRGALDNGGGNGGPDDAKKTPEDGPEGATEESPADATADKSALKREDYQLSRALDLLRGLAFFNERAIN